MNWQPIETAPKDGTEVLGLYFREWDWTAPTIYGPLPMKFQSEWVPTCEGNRIVEHMSDFGTLYKRMDLEPTHWQPMPEPPTATAPKP